MGGAPQQFMMSWDVVICCVQMGPSPPSHDMHRFEKVSGGVFLSPFTYIHLAQWPVLTSWKYIALLQNDITLVAITFKLLSIAICCFWIWCGTTNFPWPWIQSWLNLDACYPLSRKSQQRFENRFICFKAVEWLVGFWWFDYMSSCCRHLDMGWYLDDVLSLREEKSMSWDSTSSWGLTCMSASIALTGSTTRSESISIPCNDGSFNLFQWCGLVRHLLNVVFIVPSHVTRHSSEILRPTELNRTGFLVAAYLMTRRDTPHWRDVLALHATMATMGYSATANRGTTNEYQQIKQSQDS